MATPPLSIGASDLAPVISLTTDFGARDTYAAQIKAVIAGIAPRTKIIDGTHSVPPQDVLAGALALDSMVDAFADGAIHVVVVDPGVGTDRSAVAVRTPRFTLVGPDNGVFTVVLDRYRPTVSVTLNNPDYHRAPVSATFHGRDIFAPVAAHLATGVPIEALGEPIEALVNLNIPQPSETPDSLTLVVLLADSFGNLITNLTRPVYEAWTHKQGSTDIQVRIGVHVIGPIRRTFSDVEPGKPVAYFGSGDRLEVAVRNGSAANELGVLAGATVTLGRA